MEPRFLERALELAERGRGTTHPNPVVGAVVVAGRRDRRRGLARARGGPHAEVVALDAAGEKARGATVYVTLEPCAHHGATPPCVDALLAGRRRSRRRGAARPESEARRRPREAPRGGCRDGARGRRSRIPVSPADRGVAHVGHDGSAVRDVQGRDHARRPRPRSGLAVGHGGGVAEARARPAGAVGRGRGGDGHRSLGQPAPRRARRPGASGSPGASPSGEARCPTAPSSSFARGRCARSSRRSPPRASSRCSSRAGRRSRRRSSRQASSTSSSSSSRRRSRATGRACSKGCRARSSSRAWRRGRSARTCSSRRTSTSRSYASAVFTGIVRELGVVVEAEEAGGDGRSSCERPRRRRARASATRSPSTAAA